MTKFQPVNFFYTPTTQGNLEDLLRIHKDNGMMCAMFMHNYLCQEFNKEIEANYHANS